MSHPDRIGVLNVMDDPTHRELLEEMVGRMRGIIAPMLNAAGDAEQFGLLQGMIPTAGAMFAGLTVGHMIALGKMKPQDKARATKVITVAFRTAIKIGEHEARQAMLEQLPTQGSS
jgi:hypothetical protein